MDFIQRSSVKIPNAVIVDGITESVQVEEVIDFLKKYGAIQRTLLVEDESSDLHKNLIVEYAIEDGEELFAQFMSTLQDPGEKPSAYLQRLQLTLNQAVKRGGVVPGEVGKHLLKQFCRGCWDTALLSSLQLEQKKNLPPPFSELLLMLRTEEDRQAVKASRMRKHIGSTRQSVQLQSQSSCIVEPTENPETQPSVIDDLRKQALLGVSIEVPTLALVVPDVRATSQSLVLIGTNTMDVLYDTFSEGDSTNYQPAHYGYQAVIKALELRRRQASNSHGMVKLQEKKPEVVPAGKTVVIEGFTVANDFQNEKTVVVEHSSSSTLPGGLIVKSCLVDFPNQRPFKLPVVVSNVSEHDVIIPAGCKLADIGTYQSVLSQQQGPRKKATSVACGRTYPATLAPNVGLLRPGRDTEGLSKLHWSHQPRQRTATPAPAPPEQQRRPAEERGGSAATATGNRLQLASPGSSLEQPRPAAPLPGDQEPKAPCSRRRWEGDHASSPWLRGVTTNCSRPSESYLRGPAVGPPPSPSSQPLQPATPETPPPAGAAAPGLRSPGRRGRVGWACDPGEVWR
ncbi:hypothetical protein N1851_017252 [Merluccius polli]|uniref:Paraneoplastic antigen Ma-like C-terminal domain-containing protein n=1 Tax=Merluccius polli TaxID=89951 RepID=A0AA47MPS1_MERPO|nr:hypothetical protein N1851_017252 [Merluccius polli]